MYSYKKETRREKFSKIYRLKKSIMSYDIIDANKYAHVIDNNQE